MLCAVYKSKKKADTYLYLPKRDDFSDVPQPLMDMFGTPQFVMLINLATKTQLALADLAKVKEQLSEQGFYLQLPPPTENMLDELRKQNGVERD
ncbi:YcgL domain-containing protein [Pseudoalteromonas sp. BDTF-M6]|uniref:YcgL domain-containing protein n=1 Tax=Pseudoalteromonas sp. BDTF-M6 TaxID=2796132 RepID=UPI001BAFB120|nr:YcgL domain-containing protein [Pseudoalteromonas sp. BDTF-M6]MBS3797619.1 YcgL domain-containing protein [Pseudoalteromonas sp. BDTF-M6]